MVKDVFSHVDTWVFDLDHTLYPPRMRLFDQIEVRMTSYVMRELNVSRDEADDLRARYWQEHGTTLAGRMRNHDIDPDPYLVEVHDIDFSVLDPEPALAEVIRQLPGRKIIYTNVSAPYAEQVLAARGLDGLFAEIYGIEHAGYRPKPEAEAFEQVFARDGLNPKSAAMFEDDPRNLRVPHDMGLNTVLVTPEPDPHPHIHHHTDDLTGFLTQLV